MSAEIETVDVTTRVRKRPQRKSIRIRGYVDVNTAAKELGKNPSTVRQAINANPGLKLNMGINVLVNLAGLKEHYENSSRKAASSAPEGFLTRKQVTEVYGITPHNLDLISEFLCPIEQEVDGVLCFEKNALEDVLLSDEVQAKSSEIVEQRTAARKKGE